MNRLLTASLILGFAAAAVHAKPAAKVKRPKSWDKLVAFVLAKGVNKSIKAPLSRNLGYDQDAVATKAVRYKRSSAPDGREHVINAVYEKKGGTPVMREVTLDVSRLSNVGNGNHIDGYSFRLKPDGAPIAVVHSKGDLGDVVQTPLKIDSPEVQSELAAEKKFLTETMSNRDFD